MSTASTQLQTDLIDHDCSVNGRGRLDQHGNEGEGGCNPKIGALEQLGDYFSPLSKTLEGIRGQAVIKKGTTRLNFSKFSTGLRLIKPLN
jgi:hypothetical protein